MLALLLSALFGVAVLSAMTGDEDDDADSEKNSDGNTPPDEENPTEEIPGDPSDDLATVVGRDALGKFVGTSGNDTISVEAEAPFSGESPFYEWDGYAAVDILLEVDGGAGDDHLILSGSGYQASGGEGNDLIDLGDAHDVVVYGGASDTVVGGTGERALIYLGGSFVDGGGNDFIISFSNQNVDLGDGNDVIWGMGGNAQEVLGGAGNDVLAGDIDSMYLWWFHADDSNAISTDADTLDGGDGDDYLKGSHGDIMIGGAGIDAFQVNVDGSIAADAATIVDFEADQEVLTIGYYENAIPFADPPQTFDHTFFQVKETDEGDTVVLDALGNELAIVKGATGLTVGVLGEIGFDNWFDLNGNPVPKADCSILIRYIGSY